MQKESVSSDSAASLSDTPPRASLTTQWLATVERSARQMRRDVWVAISLLVVPLIFIAVIVILTQLFQYNDWPYISSPPNMSEVEGMLESLFAVPAFETLLFCSDPMLATPINGLEPCSLDAVNLTCAPANSGLPVDGFCTSLMGENVWSSIVLVFSTVTLGGFINIDNLDGLIAIQWASQVANAGDDDILPFVTAMSSLGFGVSSSTRYTSMRCSGFLYFAPAANVPADLIETLNQTYSFFRYVYGGTFETVEEAEAHIAGGSQPNWGLIQINDLDTNFDVVIRLNATALPKATTTMSMDFTGDYHSDSADMYIASGFLVLEKALLDYFLTSQMNQNRIQASTYSTDTILPLVTSTPRNGGIVNVLQQIAGPVVGFIVVLAFMYPFSHMVQSLVLEKELRIREAIQIMGVRRVALYTSYLTTNFLLCVFTALLVVLMFRLGVTPRSDPFVLLLILLLYLVSLIALAAMVASWFSSARLATQLSPLIYFIMGMPVFALGFSSAGVKVGLSILSPTAIASIISTYLQLSSGAGFGPAAFQNTYVSPRPALTMMMLAIDCVLYAVLALYFDAVLPRQWGTPKHPLFFIRDPVLHLRARCRGNQGDPADVRVPAAATRNGNGIFDDQFSEWSGAVGGNEDDGTEALPVKTGRRICVEFRDIVKQYTRDGKKFNAVDHLRLSLYEHEVSVLLGPNGAGKSTLVDTLTGMVKPDGGDAIVCGHSAIRELDVVRQYIGLCPQHNVLWEELTCYEHLEYFGKIKGLRGDALATRVAWLLDAVELRDKADQRAMELSGGQKRKLSVAIAFVGSEGLVILDEPTAGMDAGARRHTWKLLRELSKTTTILLTTHFMDEADLLGDRVALVNQGRLQCCGSSLFLKSRLGSGYTIRAELSDLVQARRLLQRLQVVVPTVELFSFSGREAQFSVPRQAVARMPVLVEELEAAEARHDGMEGFAVSGSTLEEVFLRLVRQYTRDEQEGKRAMLCAGIPTTTTTTTDTHFSEGRAGQRQPSSVQCEPITTEEEAVVVLAESDDSSGDGRRVPSETHEPTAFPEWRDDELTYTSAGYDAVGRTHASIRVAIQRAWDAEMETSPCRLWLSQFCSAWSKRWLCARRDRKLQFFQLLCPVICVLIAMLLQLVTNSNDHYLLLEATSIAPDTQTIASLCTNWFGNNATRLAAIDEGSNVSLMAFTGSPDLGYYMLDTWSTHTAIRLNAIQCEDRQLKADVMFQLEDMGIVLDGPASLLIPDYHVVTLLHNTSSPHSAPIGIQEFFSYLLENSAIPSSTSTPVAPPTVRVATQAMPSNAAQRRKERSGSVMLIAIVLCIPFVLLPSTPVGWVVKERQCKARHIQRLSGLAMSAYWLGNLAFDFAAYVVTCVLVTLLLTAFRRLEYVGTHVLAAFVVGLVANGLCSTLYSYALSFLFREYATAALATMIFNMITGVILAIVIMVLDARQHLNGDSTAVVDYICFGFRIFPCFSFSEFLLNLASFDMIYQTMGGTVWTWDYVGYPCLYMAAEIPFFALVLFIVEQPCTVSLGRRLRECVSAWFCTCWCVNCCGPSRHGSGASGQRDRYLVDADSDVESEAQAVRAAEMAAAATDGDDDDEATPVGCTDPVRVVDLVKAFGGGRRRVLAVNGVTFGVRRGEVFSLLGTNGAGKTTTISVLCQEQFPTSGHVRVDQYDTRHDREGALRKVGYCPQFDATLDLLTVREHLALYAGVRGVVAHAREGLLQDLMQVCGLTAYGNVMSRQLSGGNRRKLSVAIALMGAPSVVCLDEPSAGMDPVARRDLWTAMENIAGQQHRSPAAQTHAQDSLPPSSSSPFADGGTTASRCSVLLTTHHLEEVEALADRVGIMSHGQLCCIGTLPHLKRKFGTGYQLELRVRDVGQATRITPTDTPLAQPALVEEHDEETADMEANGAATAQLAKAAGVVDGSVAATPTARTDMQPTSPSPTSVAQHIMAWFPGAEPSEDLFGERLLFRLPAENTKLSEVFAVLNQRGASIGITDYIVAHTSIEQVFLRFCNEDSAPPVQPSVVVHTHDEDL